MILYLRLAYFRTNLQKFPLYVVLAQDNNGNGRAVGFAFLHHEDKLSIRWAVKQFCDAVVSFSATKVIFVDKDFAEISAISEMFPGVDVLLCQFHVMKYVRKVISQLPVVAAEKVELLALFKSVMHSITQVLGN